MPKYLLIARDGEEWETFAAQATPADIEACIGRYIEWSERLRSQGKLITSEKLKEGEGRVVRAERGAHHGGADRDHPHLEWGTLELRQIEEF